MEKNNHKTRYTRLATALLRPFKAFWSLFSVKKPTSVPISEIPTQNPEDCVTKAYIGVQDAQKAAILDDFDMKYAISVLKEYTMALKETTHELKVLKKAQSELKSHTKERLEAVRARNKANLGKNVASSRLKEDKSVKKAPKDAQNAENGAEKPENPPEMA